MSLNFLLEENFSWIPAFAGMTVREVPDLMTERGVLDLMTERGARDAEWGRW